MNRIEQIAKKIETLYKDIAEMESKMEVLRLAEINKVELKRNESSTSLLFKGRIINVSRNRFRRLTVKENGRVLKSDYFGNINELRFDIAAGRI